MRPDPTVCAKCGHEWRSETGSALDVEVAFHGRDIAIGAICKTCLDTLPFESSGISIGGAPHYMTPEAHRLPPLDPVEEAKRQREREAKREALWVTYGSEWEAWLRDRLSKSTADNDPPPTYGAD